MYIYTPFQLSIVGTLSKLNISHFCSQVLVLVHPSSEILLKEEDTNEEAPPMSCVIPFALYTHLEPSKNTQHMQILAMNGFLNVIALYSHNIHWLVCPGH